LRTVLKTYKAGAICKSCRLGATYKARRFI